ncbi:hypothetical protein CUZ56_01551 [Saezia sanguinis]|jgi:hemin uptake protein HemP|uniref:Hemin uptake protein HemP n=2 Tax=Saezia sanguinis TaxID=1965230 RepID=A0A433SDG0_9BURK|nr:hemin uptake protein HemP [Saezia sanguinis]RUS66760.1 hypothetical protein CUZ56_01551 [Saezia sanguinis]
MKFIYSSKIMKTLTLRRDSSLANAATQTKAAQNVEHIVHSHFLLQGAKAVSIAHNGAVYQLRATKFGKLILTK